MNREEPNGEWKPAYAILAFVDLAEKSRFENEFNNKIIGPPNHPEITMGTKPLSCRPVPQKEQPRTFYESPRCRSSDSNRRPDRRSSSPEGPGGHDRRSYSAQPWPHYSNGYYGNSYYGNGDLLQPSYGWTQPDLPVPQINSSGYYHAQSYYHWPQNNAGVPVYPTARPRPGSTAAEWISPAFQRYHRGLDYGAQGWTRGIWAGVNMCSVERFRTQRVYPGFEECCRELLGRPVCQV